MCIGASLRLTQFVVGCNSLRYVYDSVKLFPVGRIGLPETNHTVPVLCIGDYSLSEIGWLFALGLPANCVKGYLLPSDWLIAFDTLIQRG